MQLKPYTHFVTLSLSPPIYLTDYHRDFEYDGKTFIAGYVKIKQPAKQKSSPSAEDFTLDLNAIDQAMSAAFQQPYKGKRCHIQRAELSSNETVDSIETWLDGDLNKYKFLEKEGKKTMKVLVGSVFSALEKVNARNIAIRFADTINSDQVHYWGKASPRRSSSGGGSGGNRKEIDRAAPVVVP